MKILTFTKQTSRRLIVRQITCREAGEFAPGYPTQAWARQVMVVWLGYQLQAEQGELSV